MVRRDPVLQCLWRVPDPQGTRPKRAGTCRSLRGLASLRRDLLHLTLPPALEAGHCCCPQHVEEETEAPEAKGLVKLDCDQANLGMKELFPSLSPMLSRPPYHPILQMRKQNDLTWAPCKIHLLSIAGSKSPWSPSLFSPPLGGVSA